VTIAGPRAVIPALLVHAYTAVGAILALYMVHWSYQGRVRDVLWLFLVAMVIDGTDGFLARRFEVKTVTPWFDGALLDNIVDFITYAFAPMLLLWANGYLPDGPLGGVVAAIPVLSSCYQFCRSDAKTEDHYFMGFPSYWNILAFYAVVFTLSPTATTILTLLLAIMVFVPVKYIYPSRTAMWWALNMSLATAWLGLYAVITAALPDPSSLLVWLSLAYVAYYVIVSLWMTLRRDTPRPA
jgi:phosphatidylcholine synthase